MTRSLHRRFNLLDAMILIVAAAVGLALTRFTLHDPNSNSAPPTPTAPTVAPTSHSLPALVELRQIITTVVRSSVSVYPSIMTFTIATLFLRFRQPRPPFRLIFRQPGVVGCSAAVLALMVAILTLTPSTIHSYGYPNFHGWLFNVWLLVSRGAGMTIAGAWLTLSLGRRWRPEQSWVDRMGRVLSVAWIVALLLEIAAVWSSFFY
jgi:hypothetical protein